MARIKVLQVSHDYDPPFLDVSNFYSAIFDTSKYELTSLYLKGQPLENYPEKIKAEQVIFLDIPPRKMRGMKLSIIDKIRELILKEKYDIVIAQRYKAIYLVGMASLKTPPFKFIGVIHAYKVFQPFLRKLFIKYLGDKITLIGVSQAIKKDISDSLHNTQSPRVYSLPNCLSIGDLQSKLLSKKAARDKLAIPQDAFVIGTAGRLHPEKDHQTLIKAFKQLQKDWPHTKLYIMGKGKIENELKALIDRLQLSKQVFLLGMIPDGPTYFKAFDLFVLPSKLEPFGMVIIEAMAADVPIISSKSGGALEIIDDDEQLFEIGDVQSCVTLMAKFINMNEGEKKAFTDAAAEKLKGHYSLSAFRNRFWDIIGEVSGELHP